MSTQTRDIANFAEYKCTQRLGKELHISHLNVLSYTSTIQNPSTSQSDCLDEGGSYSASTSIGALREGSRQINITGVFSDQVFRHNLGCACLRSTSSGVTRARSAARVLSFGAP